MLKVIEITSRKLEASLDDVVVMSRLAESYARFGSREEASATLKRVLELEPNDGLAVYNCACAYALLKETKASLVLLRRAFESGLEPWRTGQGAIVPSTRCVIQTNFRNYWSNCSDTTGNGEHQCQSM
jgi:tetratricopeptide (TPR) repeat protein